MYLSDMHTHSIASGHGTECTITNMARAAAEKGLRLLGITDHGPGTLAAGTFSEKTFRSRSALRNRTEYSGPEGNCRSGSGIIMQT